MKHTLPCIAILILCSSATCRKAHTTSNATHTGKVLASICGNVTIQFTDGSTLGQNGWVNKLDNTGKTYDHVFKVANPCNWGNAKVNEEIRFRFVPMIPQNCVQCMAYAPTPDTAYSIEVVR